MSAELTDFPVVSAFHRVAGVFDDGDDPAVVWLRGEHDAANVAELSRALAMATARTDADLVIDLSGVEFMGASTIGAIVAARNVLLSQSRDLVVRSPSRAVARLLHICGLSVLIAPPGSDARVPLLAVSGG